MHNHHESVSSHECAKRAAVKGARERHANEQGIKDVQMKYKHSPIFVVKCVFKVKKKTKKAHTHKQKL